MESSRPVAHQISHQPAQPAPVQPPRRTSGIEAASRVADVLSQADAYFGSPAGGGGPGDAILIGGGTTLTTSWSYGMSAAAAEEYEFHTAVRGVTTYIPPYLSIGSDGRIVSSTMEPPPTKYAKRPADAPPAPRIRKPAWYAARRQAQVAHAELREALQPVPSVPAAHAFVVDPVSWPLVGSMTRVPCTCLPFCLLASCYSLSKNHAN